MHITSEKAAVFADTMAVYYENQKKYQRKAATTMHKRQCNSDNFYGFTGAKHYILTLKHRKFAINCGFIEKM